MSEVRHEFIASEDSPTEIGLCCDRSESDPIHVHAPDEVKAPQGTIRAHVEGCAKALSIPVDLCKCGGRDFSPQGAAETGDPWCESCQSWHPAPRDKAHKKALKCEAPQVGETMQSQQLGEEELAEIGDRQGHIDCDCDVHRLLAHIAWLGEADSVNAAQNPAVPRAESKATSALDADLDRKKAVEIVKRCGIRDGLFKGPRTLNAVETIAYEMGVAREQSWIQALHQAATVCRLKADSKRMAAEDGIAPCYSEDIELCHDLEYRIRALMGRRPTSQAGSGFPSEQSPEHGAVSALPELPESSSSESIERQDVCVKCGRDHFSIMCRALVGIFDYCGNDIQAIKNTAYRALPNTECCVFPSTTPATAKWEGARPLAQRIRHRMMQGYIVWTEDELTALLEKEFATIIARLYRTPLPENGEAVCPITKAPHHWKGAMDIREEVYMAALNTLCEPEIGDVPLSQLATTIADSVYNSLIKHPPLPEDDQESGETNEQG